ncbi:MAG: FAD-binding oxidoreductase [Chromatiales bacterium]|nr:FAD-binding oxidoreductase [Chromatiales bacterium]
MKQHVEHLKTLVGKAGWIDDPADMQRYLIEWRGQFRAGSPLVLRPTTVGQVAAILAYCNAHRIGVVPQGGNTGLVGGGVPARDQSMPQVILAAERLDAIRNLDVDNLTMTAEAGCVLSRLQEAASAAGLLFPLSLAAEGSCQLGGNLSSNAGGINVLRYGNARDMVLGLEVVLADGRVLSMLRGLRKDNTGYDLKQLFIGAEGTLGFITAAVCRLHPRPDSLATAFVGLDSPAVAVALYRQARRALGEEVQACELISAHAASLALACEPSLRHPLPDSAPWYLLLEVASSRIRARMEEELTAFLERVYSEPGVHDAVLATSEAQRTSFWSLRHGLSAAQKPLGASIKHDISVPLSSLQEFILRADQEVARISPGCRPCIFGHLGDGNLHYNLSQAEGETSTSFLARRAELNAAVHGVAVSLGGSFSAEHGIGQLKVEELARWRSATELELMRRLKAELDPAGIMNPGKLLPSG